MFEDFRAATTGRWYGILSSYGIDQRFLRNAHGPCPLCGGTDRYRFDDKDGRGTYYCSGCGSGDGLDLLSKYTNKSLKELMDEIAPRAEQFNVKAKNPAQNGDGRIRRIIAESVPISNFHGGIVRKYLASRGVKASPFLREHPGLKYYDADGKVVGTFPAMVALVENVTAVATLHITYLTAEGTKAPVPSVKKILTPRCSTDGAFIRLTKDYDAVGIAEGIETALAVMKMYNIPCWASGTAGMLEKFSPPPAVQGVIIYGDNDASFTGQKAAYTLAQNLVKKGKTVTVKIPDKIGDFADAWHLGGGRD